MTQNAGRGKQSVSPLKHAILEVFRRRNLSKGSTRGKRPISVGTHYAAKKHFTDETVEEKMPSRVKDGQSRKTVIQHHRKKRRSRPSKPRHGEQPKTKHRETAAVTELMRKAEDLKKVQCKTSKEAEKNGGSFAIIAKTRLTQQVGIVDKARKSQMIHRSNNEPPVNTTPHQLMSKVTHTNGSIPLNDVAGASDEGLSPAKPLSGVEGCQQPSLADVASQILLSLPIVKKEGRGYLDQLRSDLKGMCERTCMAPQPRQSRSPQTEAPKDSNSQTPCPVNHDLQHTKAIAITLESPVEAMEVDRPNDVMPEDRGKSELARLFGGFEVNAQDRGKISSQSQPEKYEYPSSQSNGSRRSRVDGMTAGHPVTALENGLRGVLPPGHIKDLLDLLDDRLTWGASSSSVCDMFDYGISNSASPGWTLQKVKPLSLSADSPSPVKLYPRRLY